MLSVRYPPLRCRAAPTTPGGRPGRRYERIQFLGGVRRHVPPDTRGAYLDHERAKSDLKAGARGHREAIGHGFRAERSKSGAVSFDLLAVETDHAAVQ